MARTNGIIVGVIVFTAIAFRQVSDIGPGFLPIGYPLIFYFHYPAVGIDMGLVPLRLVGDVVFACVLVAASVRIGRRVFPGSLRMSLAGLMAVVSAAATYMWIADEQSCSWLALPVVLSEGIVIVALVASWLVAFELIGVGINYLLLAVSEKRRHSRCTPRN